MMKINLYLVSFLFLVITVDNNIMIENFLGKHSSYITNSIRCSFKTRNFGDGFYLNSEFVERELFKMKYNFISILTDDKEYVQSITIHFSDIIDLDSYDELVKQYGEPSDILVISETEILSRSISEHEDLQQKLQKSTIHLRKGSFEENPLFVVWRKETFEIKALLRHNNGNSEVTFKSID